MRRLALLYLAATVVVAGCVEHPDDADATSEQVRLFCVTHPARALEELDWIDAPGVDGNVEAAKTLMHLSVDHAEQDAPPAIHDAYVTWARVVNDWQPDSEPLDDPGVRKAKEEVEAWLRTTCGPPTLGTAPGSLPGAASPSARDTAPHAGPTGDPTIAPRP